MEKRNKVLFWFREYLSLENNYALNESLATCSEFIPLVCFDPREAAFAETGEYPEHFANQLIKKVSLLRKELNQKGSNLLIVNAPFEKIIPSLARVLNVNSVDTDAEQMVNSASNQKYLSFRNQKLADVKCLLNMHSIPLNIYNNEWGARTTLHKFPSFPQINSGMIPTLDQFLKENVQNVRFVNI